MIAIPSAVILVNNDLIPQVRDFIVTQLFIDEYIDGYVFDQRIAANPNYIDNDVKSLNRRLLVIRDFRELENRRLFDVVVFVKNGLAAIEHNNFGPPGSTFPVLMLHWGQFCIFNTTFNYMAPTYPQPKGGCYDLQRGLFKDHRGTWECDDNKVCFPIDVPLQKTCCPACSFPYGSNFRQLHNPDYNRNACLNCGNCCDCCSCH